MTRSHDRSEFAKQPVPVQMNPKKVARCKLVTYQVISSIFMHKMNDASQLQMSKVFSGLDYLDTLKQPPFLLPLR